MITLTVGELKEALEQYDNDLGVFVAADYGDRQHTPQAIGLNELDDNYTRVTTGYSTTGYKLVSLEELDEDAAISEKVLVLNCEDIV